MELGLGVTADLAEELARLGEVVDGADLRG